MRMAQHLGTQKTWRTPATLEAITESVRRMIAVAEERGIEYIALPRIGAGLGGLSWDLVKATLEELSEGRRVMLVLCQEYVPGVPMKPGNV
jgi:O-acetyl-ADP-ribose deacetylase (regulator of RNase III)